MSRASVADEVWPTWFDLKTAMSYRLGVQLIHWSKNGVAYPFDYDPDEWYALLYMHGCTLLRYGRGNPSGYWIDEEKPSEIEAKASMQWLAENFYLLWD